MNRIVLSRCVGFFFTVRRSAMPEIDSGCTKTCSPASVGSNRVAKSVVLPFNHGFMSITGVPSIASIGPIRTRSGFISNTLAR
jgi:hypothetical protein